MMKFERGLERNADFWTEGRRSRAQKLDRVINRVRFRHRVAQIKLLLLTSTTLRFVGYEDGAPVSKIISYSNRCVKRSKGMLKKIG